MHSNFEIREVNRSDLASLVALEQSSFSSDRLSERRFKHWIKAKNRVFVVATNEQGLLGYALVFLHKGTRLARLYSIAVAQAARGLGVGKALLLNAEDLAVDAHRLYMRLEVAVNNRDAISLYEKLGYTVFDTIEDYYEDHRDALRMQKTIRHVDSSYIKHPVPWYQQKTEFTCGPAALMMAMAGLDNDFKVNLSEEIAIWREATTVFMTSGHGGCHPVGLAMAAEKRGFHSEVYINKSEPLFLEGVRTEQKKNIMRQVDADLKQQAQDAGVSIHYQDVSQAMIEQWLQADRSVIILISTYRIDGKKAPHWVTVSAMDDECIYIHDPDPPDDNYRPLDCQYVPIARNDFDKMSGFGANKLRSCVVIANS